MSLEKLLAETVEKLGLRLETPDVQPPPGFTWVRDVIAEAHNLRIVVRAMGSEKEGRLILAMPIGFSQTHQQLIQMLPAEQRIKLISRMITSVATTCPHCRVGIGGTPVNPQGVIAEIHYVEKPARQRLADDITLLLNVFLIVNAILWDQFPSTAPTGQPQLYT